MGGDVPLPSALYKSPQGDGNSCISGGSFKVQAKSHVLKMEKIIGQIRERT